MKSFLLGLMLFASVPMFSGFDYSPSKEIIGVSFTQEAYAQEAVVPASTITLDEVLTKASEAAVSEADVKPYFEIFGKVLAVLNTSFPKVGPYVQGASEIIGGISSLFTILVTFLLAFFQIPIVAARLGGAHEKADKIQKFSEKILPWFKYLSIFNVQKKK